MLEDQLDLLSVFNANGVDYIVVGGHAVNAYTQARATKDLDVLVRNNEENAIRVFRALAQFGAPIGNMSPADFSGNPSQYFQIGIEPDRIDILQGISGVSFPDAWESAMLGDIEGLPVRFLSREHLIANKLASGRPRDLGDVDELRKFSRGQ